MYIFGNVKCTFDFYIFLQTAYSPVSNCAGLSITNFSTFSKHFNLLLPTPICKKKKNRPAPVHLIYCQLPPPTYLSLYNKLYYASTVIFPILHSTSTGISNFGWICKMLYIRIFFKTSVVSCLTSQEPWLPRFTSLLLDW